MATLSTIYLRDFFVTLSLLPYQFYIYIHLNIFFSQGLKPSRSEGGGLDGPGLSAARQPGLHRLHGLWTKPADQSAAEQKREHEQTADPLQPR